MNRASGSAAPTSTRNDRAGRQDAATGDSDTRPPLWHALESDDVLAALDTGARGLDGDEAARRLVRYGANRSRPADRRSPLARFVLQFHNFLIYVLLVSGTLLAALGHWLDASVVFGVTFINALIGFFQEGKAEQALESMRELLALGANVVRGGARGTVAAEDLVPGDVVLLFAGDRVPADLRLLEASTLQVQEALLTGESMPVDKDTAPVAPDTALADRTCMVYSGTLATYGQGSGVVVATGADTELGRVGAMLAGIEPLTTPLLRQLERFGRRLTLAIVVLAVATFAYGWLVHDFSAVDMFLAAVGLAVAAIPEGLPAIVTITLAIGVRRMAGLNAVIRRLPAVEALGSVSVVCSDKTGTLTRNEMMVRSVATANALYTVTGDGYAPQGEFRVDDRAVDAAAEPLLAAALRAAAFCNDATIVEHAGEWMVQGDPTEGALLAAAIKGGVDIGSMNDALPRDDTIPFESAYRFMATLHRGRGHDPVVFVKGAPEQLLAMAARQLGNDGEEPLDTEYWRALMLDIAGRAERVLAVARKSLPDGRRSLDAEDVASGLTLLALFGIADPPRAEALDAVARCRAAGTRVKMITGDHMATARAVARDLGLENADDVLTGAELEQLDGAELARRVHDTDVFARTSPEHKLRLIRALQAQDLVVAMTGDGVNDAPALKQADVGVAMGRKGTEVAKDAAEMVITDDNFASIVAAIEQGRTVYDNIRKSIVWILPTSFGEAFVIIMAVLLGQALPITAAQVLWVNMVTTVTLALALAFERPEHDVMRRPPRRVDEPLMSRFVLWRTVMVTVLFVAGTFAAFTWYLESGASLELSRTVAVNTIVMFEMFYLFNVRRARTTLPRIDRLHHVRPALLAVGVVVVLQLGFTYLPPMQNLFGTAAMTPAQWAVVIGLAACLFIVVELEKRLLGLWEAH